MQYFLDQLKYQPLHRLLSTSFPSFTEILCPDPVTSVGNSSVSGSGVNIGATRTFTCFQGHEFPGGHQQENITCQNVNAEGVWSELTAQYCSSKNIEEKQ